MLTLAIPLEAVLYPLLSILIYSACLKGGLIFDNIEVIPQAQRYPFQWKIMCDQARPFSSFFMACWCRWPGTYRGVHAANCWIHALNAFLVEHLALSLGAPPPSAFITGLFFVAMPFAASTVAYMTGHANLWATTFGLLGALAILSGWGILSLPCLFLAYFSKEDGLGFAVTFELLALFRHDYLAALSLLLAGLLLLFIGRHWLKRIVRERGDEQMSVIGLPVAYPQPRHFRVVLLATLRRIPFWALGFKQSPYHGSGIQKW